jgi:ATP-binding cassette subfamily F protein 3
VDDGRLPAAGERAGRRRDGDGCGDGRAGEVQELEKQLHALEQAGDVSSPEYLEAHAKHEALSNPQVDAKAKKMLRGLGLSRVGLRRKAKEMSGGWVMRAHLARLLVMEPDLLLLDEPTNHLDLLSLLWLQDYLKNYSGALLLISHDRQFMDEVVESVYEISEQKLIGYTGNYSEFLKQREANYEQQLAAYNNQQKEIARLREFYDRFRQVASKASQAMSKLKQIERMELVEKPLPPKKPFRFNIRSRRAAGSAPFHWSAFTRRTAITRFTTGSISRSNAASARCWSGRTARANPRCSRFSPACWSSRKANAISGHNAKIGYFSQHRADTLDANKSVLQEVMDAAPTLAENEARGILGSFLFRKTTSTRRRAC